MSHNIFNAKDTVESQRDTGYKNEAYAIAELMDNSIQAKATIVELITYSKPNGDSQRQNINTIVIFDNGIGMDKELLRRSLIFGGGDNRKDVDGMGKFGFGLPSASISQARRVEVWSWQNGISNIQKTYIDVDEMLDGTMEQVPKPISEALPIHISQAIGDVMPSSGTVVQWSEIDRAKWKTAAALTKHVEHEIGRMYRYFIAREKKPVTIRFKSYDLEGRVYRHKVTEVYKASDPLGLMKNTSLPKFSGDFANECFFELGDERTVLFKNGKGKEFPVRFRWSIARQVLINAILEDERRKGSNKTAGNTDWGKYAAKNQGFSIVRAGRELVLRKNMLPKEEKWRFIGMEMEFPPGLDKVFGVPNNKQEAWHIQLRDSDQDAENEGYETSLEYLNSLDENDPLRCLYEVSNIISDFKKEADARLKSLKIKIGIVDPNIDDEDSGTISVPTTPNIEDPAPEPLPETDELVEALIKKNFSPEIAAIIARKVESEKVRYVVQEMELNTDAFFDVMTERGITLILINKNHVFYTHVLQNCDDSQKVLVELAIGSFGYMEHSSRHHAEIKARYAATRRAWGVYLENVLLAAASEDASS